MFIMYALELRFLKKLLSLLHNKRHGVFKAKSFLSVRRNKYYICYVSYI